MVTTSRIWGAPTRGHRHLQEPLQTPSMDLRPAEAMSEESSHLHSVLGALPQLSEPPATGPGWGRSRLQAPFCSESCSEGGAPACLGSDVSQDSWPFLERASLRDQGGTRHILPRSSVVFPGEGPAGPLQPEAPCPEPLLIVQVGQRPPLPPACLSQFSSCRATSLLVASCGSPVHVLGAEFSSSVVLEGNRRERA